MKWGSANGILIRWGRRGKVVLCFWGPGSLAWKFEPGFLRDLDDGNYFKLKAQNAVAIHGISYAWFNFVFKVPKSMRSAKRNVNKS